MKETRNYHILEIKRKSPLPTNHSFSHILHTVPRSHKPAFHPEKYKRNTTSRHAKLNNHSSPLIPHSSNTHLIIITLLGACAFIGIVAALFVVPSVLLSDLDSTRSPSKRIVANPVLGKVSYVILQSALKVLQGLDN